MPLNKDRQQSSVNNLCQPRNHLNTRFPSCLCTDLPANKSNPAPHGCSPPRGKTGKHPGVRWGCGRGADIRCRADQTRTPTPRPTGHATRPDLQSQPGEPHSRGQHRSCAGTTAKPGRPLRNGSPTSSHGGAGPLPPSPPRGRSLHRQVLLLIGTSRPPDRHVSPRTLDGLRRTTLGGSEAPETDRRPRRFQGLS